MPLKNLEILGSILILLSSVLLVQAFQYLPQVAKWLCLIVFALNFRSWPFGWHFRVFLPILQVQFAPLLFRLRYLLHSAKEREAAKRKWVESLSPIGKNPFDVVSKYRSWTGFDDGDYNFHLSNSSYAKILDMARMKAALECFPAYVRTGGFLVLGGTHFSYLREIPLLSKYEVRVSIASWDHKWIYLICRFVTVPKSANSHRATLKSNSRPSDALPIPPLVSAVPSTPTRTLEPDGAIVHCISINKFVFKLGRLTIPPSLALALEGYCSPSPSPDETYSSANPPPHWKHVQAIGGSRALAAFLKNGWKELKNGERWWEEALGGDLEKRRIERLGLVGGVTEGMEGAVEIVTGAK